MSNCIRFDEKKMSFERRMQAQIRKQMWLETFCGQWHLLDTFFEMGDFSWTLSKGDFSWTLFVRILWTFLGEF